MATSQTRAQLVAIPRIERAAHAVGLYVANEPRFELTQAEAHVLAFLHPRSEARINEIHEAFGHRRSTLTSVLDRLEKRGLVERTSDPDDRRGVVVALTSSGAAQSKEVFAALSSLESAALAKFSKTEVAAFVSVLEALTATVAAESGAP
jgi:DNA-binding MarR family transcriptional regulator